MGFQRDRATAVRHAITVRCLLFGRYAEVLGVEAMEITLPARATVRDAVESLRACFPAGVIPERPLTALNQRHVLPNEVLEDGDELGLLPPLAGG